MNIFLLPHAFPMLFKKINIVAESESSESSESFGSLAQYLYEIKEKICLVDTWDIYKEYTNPYEYIHTKAPNRKSVATYQPLSRSYFKMVELLKQFDMLEKYQSQSIQTFHLAEGPGGFTEAVVNARKRQAYYYSKKDKYYAITLIQEDNKLVPNWKKSQHFIRNHPQISIENGFDKTGNLLHLDNFTDLVAKYGSQMELVTADGGFDFSQDFNRQELCILPLLVAQICFGLCLQKYQGTFILKVFDCFLKPTVDLLYLLSSFYEKVHITKPLTSRLANSEKYIVCENFHYDNHNEFYPYLFYLMKSMTGLEEWSPNLRFLRISIPRLFLTKLEEYNLILGHQQINNIFSTLSLIGNGNKINKNQKIDYLIRLHTSKCLYWCQKHSFYIV